MGRPTAASILAAPLLVGQIFNLRRISNPPGAPANNRSGTKRGDVIVCAATACSRARLRTEPRPSGSGCAIIYDALFRMVWRAARNRCPVLREQIAAILASEPTGSEDDCRSCTGGRG